MLDLVSQLDAAVSKKTVDIITFAEDPKFCGKALYPRQKLLLKILFLMDLTDEEHAILDYWEAGGQNGTEIEIAPRTRERMQYLKDAGYPHFREVILVGGRRSSKGFLTAICAAYKIYNLIQYEDPIKHFGIDHEISFSVIAASQDQAAKQQYADFSNTVNGCMALQPYLFKLQELEFSVMTKKDLRQMEIWKAKGVRAQRLKDISSVRGNALPANSRTIRGASTMLYVFDEVGHFMQGESDQSDTEVYAAANPSLAQFGRHAMIFLNSSPYSKTGILYQHFTGAMEIEEDGIGSPTTFAFRYPSWALYEGWWDSEEAIAKGIKKVQYANPGWDPGRKRENGEFFYTEEDRYAILQARKEERDDPDKFKVESRARFAEVLDAYLNPESVDRMFAGVPNEDGITYVPLQTNMTTSSNEFQYRAHLDPSSTTEGFGFALGHVEKITVSGKEEEHVVFDIIRRWRPDDFPNNVIQWEPILEEVVFWIDIFRPTDVTFDSHQSAFPISWLTRTIAERRLGETRVYTKKATSELNWNRAEVFKTALYRGLVHAPHDTADCDYAEMELKSLQISRTSQIPKVAHPDVGPCQTDDVYDAISHVVEAFIGNSFSRAMRDALTESPRFGAQGGYRQARVVPRPLMSADGEPFNRNSGSVDKKLARTRGATRSRNGRPVSRKLPGW